MVDVSNVSQWVKKAVADIAAFDGKLRKIDTEAEKKALSTLLAGDGLSNDDKDYVEGFMLDRTAKTEKFDGKKPVKNEARSVELPYRGPLGAMNEEEMSQLQSMYDNVQLFFDENGEVKQTEIRGQNGEVTLLSNAHRLSEDEMEFTTQSTLLDGSVSEFKGVRKGKSIDDYEFKPLYNAIKKDNEVLQEQCTESNGTITKTTYFNTNAKSRFVHVPLPKLDNPDDINTFMSQVASVEEIYKDGNVTIKYKDSNGNVISSQDGTYEQDKYGNINTKFPYNE